MRTPDEIETETETETKKTIPTPPSMTSTSPPPQPPPQPPLPSSPTLLQTSGDNSGSSSTGTGTGTDTFTSLHHSLLGPSLLKSGQESVNQAQIASIIYRASLGTKYFENEHRRDQALTTKISHLLAKKSQLEKILHHHHANNTQDPDTLRADKVITHYESTRDLTQHIVHIDCDAFYASVEELDHPELKSLPFAVGKGVITTCNYIARTYGVRSGMATHIANILCPQLISLPLNIPKYAQKADEIRAILGKYDERYEAASCDEAYLNITGFCEKSELGPEEVVTRLRKEVKEVTGICVSAGIAPNVRVAKIASNVNKPDGQFRVENDREEVMRFMESLPVRKVNGIGRVFERELEAIGINTCGDIYPLRGMLTKLFGEKSFRFLVSCFLGIGRTQVRPAGEYERKSVGTENTFRDISGGEKLREKLRVIALALERELEEAGVYGRTLVLKVKLGDFRVVTRQRGLVGVVRGWKELWEVGVKLLGEVEKVYGEGVTVRLMGLRVVGLVDVVGGKSVERNRFFENLRGGGRVMSESESGSGSGDGGRKRKSRDGMEDADGDGDGGKWGEEEGEEQEEQEEEEEEEEDDEFGESYDDEEMQEEQTLKNSCAKGEGEDSWPCPVCFMLIAADDKVFNEHVDFCLSRGAIREVVGEASPSAASSSSVQQQQSAKRARTGDSHGEIGPAGGETSAKEKGKEYWSRFVTK